MAGWTVFADLDNDAALDAGEPVATIDPVSREYTITGLTPDKTYIVRVLAPSSSWNATGPSAGWQSVPVPVKNVFVVAPNKYINFGQTAENVDFGFAHTAEIRGTVRRDVDGDGLAEATEPGVARQTVYLDLNGNGVNDETTRTLAYSGPKIPILDYNPPYLSYVACSQVKTAATSGQNVGDDRQQQTSYATWYRNLGGLSGVVRNITVNVSLRHPSLSDVTVVLVSPRGTHVTLFSAIGGAALGRFYDVTLDDSVPESIADAAQESLAPGGSRIVSGRYRPQSPAVLSVLRGEDPNGVWTLQVWDAGVNGQFGWLDQWSVTITYGDATTTTDANGAYAFTNLPAGSYVVAETPASGESQTYPATPVLYGIAPYSKDPENGTDPQLIKIDPATGGAVALGTTGTLAGKLIGLAAGADGELYTISAATRSLYHVNPVTGALVEVMPLGFNCGGGDLAIPPGGTTAYVVTTDVRPKLYAVDFQAKTVLDGGELYYEGQPLPAATNVSALAFRPDNALWGGTLYGLITDSSGGTLLANHLVRIVHVLVMPGSIWRWVVEDVGPLDFLLGSTAGMTYDAGQDVFYAACGYNDNFYRIDPATGHTTYVGHTGVTMLSGLTLASDRGAAFAGRTGAGRLGRGPVGSGFRRRPAGKHQRHGLR